MIKQKLFKGLTFVFSILVVSIFLTTGNYVLAEEQATESVAEETAVPDDIQKAIEAAADQTLKAEQKPEEVKIDTEIQAEDLEVKEARVLPDNFLYGFKNIFRGVRTALTFDPIKKAEYRLKISNEKIVEAKQLIENKKTDKAREIASKTIENANKDFDKIVAQGEKLKTLKIKNAAQVDKFLDKVADHSLKQQVLLQKLEDQVPEESFARIEGARQAHLEKFSQVMDKAAENQNEIRDRFAKVVEEHPGSDFKELKAVEILRDLEDKADPSAKEALRMAQAALSQKFEIRFLTLPEKNREEKFSQYVEFLPGNPVRQFEALDRMKQSFQSADAVPALEIGKDKAIRKFENQFNQFSNDEARANFMEPWRNGDTEDLRTMTEIQMRMEPPELAQDPTANAVFQQFKPFQEEAQQNFRQRLEKNPEEMRNDPAFQRMRENPDIVDLRFSQDLNQMMQKPEGLEGQVRPVDPNAENFIREFQKETVQNFVENIQQPRPAQFPEGAERREGFNPLPKNWQDFGIGPPVPGGLEILQEIKNKLPQQAQAGINQAINVQTQMIERHIQKTDDPVTFQRFEQQIEQNSDIKKEIQTRRGSEFFNQMDQRGQVMEKIQQDQQEQKWQKMQEINQQMFGSRSNESGGKPVGEQEGIKILPQEMKSKIEEFRKIRPQSEQPPQLLRPEGLKPRDGGQPQNIQPRQERVGPPERPIIPLPGSPGFSGPPGASAKPEEVNPPPAGQQPIQQQPGTQQLPPPPPPTESISQNLF